MLSKSIIFLFIIPTFILPLKAHAAPAYDGLFTMKQPFGVFFEARQCGDEWHNWIETKEGFGIYRNMKTGNWEYYLPEVDANTERQTIQRDGASHAVVGVADPFFLGISKGLRATKDPTIKSRAFDFRPNTDLQISLTKRLETAPVNGIKYLLVIGVDYVDQVATYTKEQIQPLVFGNRNSVSDYYSKVSYSSVTITPASELHETLNDGFVGWLRLSGNHPNTGSSGWSNTSNQQIAKDAILAADPYVDYASYDSNGDGIVGPSELSIIIIVAGYEAAYDGSFSPSVWAHYSWMSTIGYPFADGKTIQEYVEIGEKHGDHLATFGIMVHELGHLMFKLPDLYDTDSVNGDSAGIGYFDAMGTGIWGTASGGNAGSSPTLLSAWSKECLSWGKVTTISSNQSVSFPKSDGNNSSVFLINTTDPNQYFLIENRQFTGYDGGFQGAAGLLGHGGLVIYHIDRLKTGLWSQINGDENDKGVDVNEANEGYLGYSMLDTNKSHAHTNMFFFSGNNEDFNDSTTPGAKLKNNSSTSISITDISIYGDTMTATVSLLAQPPSVITGSATQLTSNSVTLNGTVNANGLSTMAWFEFGPAGSIYSSVSSMQSVSGSNDEPANIDVSGLSSGITYHYRIVAQNSEGITYGNEETFITMVQPTSPPPTSTPASTPTITPTVLPSPSPTATPAFLKIGKIYGYVKDRNGEPIESAVIKLRKLMTEVEIETASAENGYYEFTNLEAGKYKLTAKKSSYKCYRGLIMLMEEETKEVEIDMKKLIP